VVIYKIVDAFYLPEGDYNEDGTVDAADYTLWRDTLGQEPTVGTQVRRGSGADGNRNGVIDAGDYDVWAAHFGETISGSGSGSIANVPEPTALLSAIIGLLVVGAATRRSRCPR
jgi:hypothetical protein